MIHIKLPSTRGLKIISELDNLFKNKLNSLIGNKNKDDIFDWIENEINNYKKDTFWFSFYIAKYFISEISKVCKKESTEYTKAKNYLNGIKTLDMTSSKKKKIPLNICTIIEKYDDEFNQQKMQ